MYVEQAHRKLQSSESTPSDMQNYNEDSMDSEHQSVFDSESFADIAEEEVDECGPEDLSIVSSRENQN